MIYYVPYWPGMYPYPYQTSNNEYRNSYPYPYQTSNNEYRNSYPVNMYYAYPYYYDNHNYALPTYPINEVDSYLEANYPSDRQSTISLQNAANTKWKDHYLDIDGNTGQVILWPRLEAGAYWKLTDHGNGTVSLQNTANTKWKDHYLDIDGNTGQVILWPRLLAGAYWKSTIHNGPIVPPVGTSTQDCSVTGGKGKKLDSGKKGIADVLELEYIIYECAIEVKPGIAGINTGGTYTLSATKKGVSAIWPIVPEASRYVFSVYVENKTLWVDLEMQHRTLQGFPPKFVWRKTWGVKTELGSWANLKF